MIKKSISILFHILPVRMYFMLLQFVCVPSERHGSQCSGHYTSSDVNHCKSVIQLWARERRPSSHTWAREVSGLLTISVLMPSWFCSVANDIDARGLQPWIRPHLSFLGVASDSARSFGGRWKNAKEA